MTSETTNESIPAKGHERYVAFVHYLYELTRSNPSRKQSSLSAFEAMEVIAGYWRFVSEKSKTNADWEPDPEALVTIPFWVVDYLARTWVAYCHDAPKGQPFGEALGLEGGGQGKRPAREQWRKHFRDLRLAHEVWRTRTQAEQRGKHLTLENAFARVADERETTEEIVRHAWKKHGRRLPKHT